MELALMIPILGILFAIVWVIVRTRNKKDKRVLLYKSLMSEGCQLCGGKLGLGDFTQQYMNVECDDCGKTYQIDTMVEMAWELDNG